MKYPFEEIKKENYYIRTFKKTLGENELKWHYDEEDRIIISEEETSWKLQFDNELPKTLNKNEKFFIKKGVYHRLIKGDNDLKLKIYKL